MEPMKSKASSVIESKVNALMPKLRAPSRRTNGNGHAGSIDVHLNKNAALQDSPPRPKVSGASHDSSKDLDKGQLLIALRAFKRGDFSARLPVHLDGLDGKIADAFNDVIEMNERMSHELSRLSRVVGKEGK